MSVTQHRDLRTGLSIWEATSQPRPTSIRLPSETSTEVLVIGAGISGVLTAHALTQAGLEVLIVDRRGPAFGSTAASTALLQYEIDTPLITLVDRVGEPDAIRIWRRSRTAVISLLDAVRSLDIDAQVDHRQTLQLEGDTLDAEALSAECEARRHAGFDASFLTPAETASRFGPRRAAILSTGNATADPIRLTLGFLGRAIAAGARLAYPVEITSIDPGDHIVARTNTGTIHAKRLVFATGYELAHGVPREGHSVISTWAFATKTQPGNLWPHRAMIWEASDPYLYMRTGPKGEVICGGEDEDLDDQATRDRLIPNKIEAIRRKLANLFPRLDTTPAYAWTGNFGASESGLPSIGEVPGMPNCHAVLGFGGNGITFSQLAADIVAGSMSGKPDPDAELFAFAPHGPI